MYLLVCKEADYPGAWRKQEQLEADYKEQNTESSRASSPSSPPRLKTQKCDLEKSRYKTRKGKRRKLSEI